MRSRPWHISILFCTLLAARGEAQTTQPVPASWEETVVNVSRILIEDSDDITALAALVPDGASLRRFGETVQSTRYGLKQKTAGNMVVSARAYIWPGDGIVSGLASDVRANEAIPDVVRRQLIPHDDADTKRANFVATQWIANVMKPAAGEFIALIVVCEPPPPITVALLTSSTPVADPKPPVFVLIKGHQTESGEVSITHIAFGDAKQALN